MPTDNVLLFVGGEDIERKCMEIDDAPATPMHIEVSRQLRMRVLPTETESADTIEVHNAHGERLMLRLSLSGVTSSRWRADLSPADEAPVIEVVDHAQTLVLFRGDEVVRRVDLALRTGQINDVRI